MLKNTTPTNIISIITVNKKLFEFFTSCLFKFYCNVYESIDYCIFYCKILSICKRVNVCSLC